MKKLFLIDAYAMIYRAYYAFIRNPRVNSKGLNTSAIFGFVNTLEDILRRESPTHIAVVFDPKGKTFRHEIFPEYKAQRESTPEDIKLAIPIIHNLLKAYNISSIEVAGFEADDVIGTMAKIAEQKEFQVFMLTPDKDYGQLVSENIFMYRPKHSGGFEIMGIESIKEKYGLDSQLQVIDLLGLMGDSSDNIPGCPGVGEKTAIELLKEFGSIEQLFLQTDKLKGKRKTNIEDNKEQILFSKFLATIKTDVPMEFDEEALALKERNHEDLKAIFNDLEFRTMASKVGTNPFTSFPPDASIPSISMAKKKKMEGQMSMFDEPSAENELKPTNVIASPEDSEQPTTNAYKNIKNTPHTYHLITTKPQRAELISKLFAQKSICFDTETTGLDTFSDQLVGLSFAFKENEAYYVSLPEDKNEATNILLEFKPIFESEQIQKIGQNIKFDLLMLKQYKLELRGDLFDTMIAHYLIQPDIRHGMDYLAEIYLNYKTIKYEDLVGAKGKKQLSIREVGLSALCDYAAEDADITLKLKLILEKQLQEEGLMDLFKNVEMPLLRVLAQMEQNGVKIDSDALSQSSVILSNSILEIEKDIHKLAGAEFNVSSPAQVGEILFEKLALDPKAKKTKTGQYSTAEEVLEKLRSKHPIVNQILEYRGLKKLLNTYIDALPLLVNPQTDRIHTSYNQTVAATGRLSSTNPNLQNIPIRDAQGKEIRKAFIPAEGCVFLSADYSQIELRIMAHLSQDPNMIEAFSMGADIHAATAAKIYKIPVEEVTSDMRRKAKTANFGIIYGISAFGLSERLNIPRSEAKTIIEEYFNNFPAVKNYMDSIILSAKEKGFVETILGRKRHLADINSQNSIVRAYAERNAINAPIQGSAADIIKMAMINIQNRLNELNLKTQMTMQVHDELNFNVPVEELDIVKQTVIQEMENAVSLSVKLTVETGLGKNWLDAH